METETKKNSKHVFKGFRLLKNPFALLFYIVIIIYALSLLIPCAWMIISSLRPSGQFTDAPFGIPKTINLNNYLLGMICCGYSGFVSSASYCGPHYKVSHDISLLIPLIILGIFFAQLILRKITISKIGNKK